MKTLLTFLALPAIAAAAPELPVDQALKIANGYLKENSRKDTWITSIALEATTMNSGRNVWAVKWNAPVILTDTKRETGLEIAMDGSYARYTVKVANA